MNNNRFLDNKGVSHPIVNGTQPAISLRSSLGLTILVMDMNAARTGEHRYRPYGENRFFSQSLPTTFDFTGQRIETSLGLHYFQARWYDSQLGRFVSADTIIPRKGGALAWDRYLFVLGNPLKYTDPSGHATCDEEGNCFENGKPTKSVRFGESPRQIPDKYKNWGTKGINSKQKIVNGHGLSDYERDLLTLAVYTESSNVTWPDEIAVEMIAWVYLNKVTILGQTMRESIAGANCGGCYSIAIPSNVSDSSWLESFIQEGLLGSKGSQWSKAQEISNRVYLDWMKYGTGSGSDPTNGSIFFYVSKSPSNWEAVISKYERISEDNPGFRWATSEIFQWEGYSRMLISRTAYPSDYH